jgi:hypothetical protein
MMLKAAITNCYGMSYGTQKLSIKVMVKERTADRKQ